MIAATDIPEGFEPQSRRSPLTDPWEPIYSRQTPDAIILGLWLAGGIVYLYDYRLGFGLYYILSMLHVFLEFPLNHQTLVDIGKALRAGRWWSLDSQQAA